MVDSETKSRLRLQNLEKKKLWLGGKLFGWVWTLCGWSRKFWVWNIVVGFQVVVGFQIWVVDRKDFWLTSKKLWLVVGLQIFVVRHNTFWMTCRSGWVEIGLVISKTLWLNSRLLWLAESFMIGLQFVMWLWENLVVDLGTFGYQTLWLKIMWLVLLVDFNRVVSGQESLWLTCTRRNATWENYVPSQVVRTLPDNSDTQTF